MCGESFLPLLDALHDRPQLRLISCRHEAGAAMMAEASAKLSGEPGVCLVSRGPGACHATIGLHTAMQDATPLVMLVGQVPRHYLEREAQQEIEYRRMLGPLAKWVAQIDQVERIPELVHRAFRVAASGRAGPVVLVLPEDMLEERTSAIDCPPAPLARAYPGAGELAAMRQLLEAAERPVADRRRRVLERRCMRGDCAIRRRQRPPRVLQLSPPGPRLLRSRLLRRASSRCRPTRCSCDVCAMPTWCWRWERG